MKAYKGTFIKKNGDTRDMLFAYIPDLPKTFLDKVISGEGNDRQYPEGMELVWDLEEDNFRVFNKNTQVGEVKTINVDLPDLMTFLQQ